MSEAFTYAGCELPVRDDIVAANRKTWDRIARPGNWWTGAERVALAAAVRHARDCGLCRERKSALSPNAVQGEHCGEADDCAAVSAAAVDTVHRIVTDQSRLSKQWQAALAENGIDGERYVELLGVVVTTVSIDALHFALGLAPEPLPEPVAGEPSRYRPPGLVEGDAWVPMLSMRSLGRRERDLFPPLPGGAEIANVLRAMSLVPDAVRSLNEQAGAYYMRDVDVADPTTNAGRALSRPQIELIAGRVSVLNECFY